MLVYGDRSERLPASDARDRLRTRLAAAEGLPAGLDRHSALVGAFILAGRIVQGLADIGDPAARPMEDFLLALADSVRRSWQSGFERAVLPDLPALGALPEIEMKLPEGYAFYALYPEAYLEAAQRLDLLGPPMVIGIRSIGTGLAALVAAALGAPRPLTVRPGGHPFDRRLALPPEVQDELRADPEAHFVIVDEGPGLSGSSFGAVADWLEEAGVAADRIAFLPSHGGDLGPEAQPRHRARWAAAQRRPADLGPRLPELLAGWAAERLGPLDGPLEDISGGAWRNRFWSDEARWPAAHVGQERLKYIARAGGRAWRLKFAGLGEEGEARLAKARILHAAGLTPEPHGLVHGFLVESWHDDAEHGRPPLGQLALYLGARAHLLPAPVGPGGGASLAELLTMARRNIFLALGAEAAAALDRREAQLPRLESLARPIDSDNRLDPHEWIRLSTARWLKTDGLDHSADHDLIGCQDLAWDVAGAAVEWDLDAAARQAFADLVSEAAGRRVEPELLDFFEPAYLAYRLGRATLAAQSLAGWPAEAARLQASADAYAARLARLLSE